MIGPGYFGTQSLEHTLLQLSHLKWYLGPEHTHTLIQQSTGGNISEQGEKPGNTMPGHRLKQLL